MGRNEWLATEISIPIFYVVRKWMPDPTHARARVPTGQETHKGIYKHAQQAGTITYTRNLPIPVDTEG